MRFLLIIFTIVSGYSFSFAVIAEEKNEHGLSSNLAVDRYYVGADRACEYSSLQAAINAAAKSVNPPEILVADNRTYEEDLTISISNILIDGGFSNCSNARTGTHSGNKAKLRSHPASSSATIDITGIFVTIKNVQLDMNSGVGIRAKGTSVITLENMLFFQLGDSAIDMGGFGQVDLTVKNSVFLLNQATNGGAIACSGPTHSIDVTDGSSFANNSATGFGGAVFLEEDCEFSMSTGGFQNNTAGWGGGLIALSGATVDLNQVSFNSNMAEIGGGAISATGNSTLINAEATHFLRNESSQFGGAIAIEAGAGFTIKRTSKGCFDSSKCNLFDGNKALTDGGAVANIGGDIDISSTHFENNRANRGTAYFSSAETSSNKIEGSIFTQNGNHAAGGYNDENVVRATAGADFTITYSTFADNRALFATLGLSNAASIFVYSSIISDSSSGDVFNINGGSTHDADCLLVHESGSFDTNNARVTVGDPKFIDAANQNYHINAALSPAVDYCSDSQALAQHKDIDFQVRGFDNLSKTNKFGPYDIGADESLGNQVFGDGFE